MPTGSDGTIVRFDNVEFGYQGRGPVLRRLNLSLGAGQVVALVGRSGAGKSTLLKLINRLLLPTSGRVVVEGHDTREWDGIRLRLRIGYVFERTVPHAASQNVEAAAPRAGLRTAEPARVSCRPGLTAAEFLASPMAVMGSAAVGVAPHRVDPLILLMDELRRAGPAGGRRSESSGVFSSNHIRRHRT
jgi:ABC-type phosphate transport system ATPase subunit